MFLQRRTSLKGLALRVAIVLVGVNLLEIPLALYGLNKKEDDFGQKVAIESARKAYSEIDSFGEYLFVGGLKLGSKIYSDNN